MTSRSSFEETARYWTRIYAGGPADESKSGQDPVAIAGLEKAHVDRFEALGFPRDKVVSFNGVHGSLLLFDRAVMAMSVLLGGWYLLSLASC